MKLAMFNGGMILKKYFKSMRDRFMPVARRALIWPHGKRQ